MFTPTSPAAPAALVLAAVVLAALVLYAPTLPACAVGATAAAGIALPSLAAALPHISPLALPAARTPGAPFGRRAAVLMVTGPVDASPHATAGCTPPSAA